LKKNITPGGVMHGYNKIDAPRIPFMYGLSILVLICTLAIMFACVSGSTQKPAENLPPYESISDALYTLVFYHGLMSNKKEQSKILEQITKIDKTYSPAYAYLGELALEDNKLEVAKSNFTKAIGNDPNNFIALTGLANTLLRNNDYTKAIESFDKAIAVDPEYSYNYNDRSKAKSLIHDWDGRSPI
jgi:tetratricopeptide (TPR) repeat protein